jgi:predicted phosphoribosyltransferase/dienelactone hydrolase
VGKNSLMVFADRRDAGRRLAAALEHEELGDAIVVGLARGGVEVAAEVAAALDLPLDVLAVRKVGHPWEPEYAIGAVTPGGSAYVRGHDGLTDEQVAAAAAAARRKADELDARLHAGRPPVVIQGKTCVLVDDGLATGATMKAAVLWARDGGARRVIVAVPVGAAETVTWLRDEADRVIALEEPEVFMAVGLWYRDFSPIDESRVLAVLREARANATPVTGPRAVLIPAGATSLAGDLTVPPGALGVVAFAHGSGSGRLSPRNRLVADWLNNAGFATLLFDLLTEDESLLRTNVFDIPLLASRLTAADRWLREQPGCDVPVGYFGASTGAAAALWAAAELGEAVGAVVSRGGRPDLAGGRLPLVKAPTLLVVGSLDATVLELNRVAAEELACEHELAVVPGATHLFEEPGALEAVAGHASRWFARHLARA